MSSTIIDAPRVAGPTAAVLEALLREQHGEQPATVTAFTSEPLVHAGTNDGSALFRVAVAWTQPSAFASQQATWIVKHWRAGQRDRGSDTTQAREVLAWQRGLLRPAAMPAGLRVPIVAAWRSPSGNDAWLAMTDVATDLAAYPRLGLAPSQAVSRVQAVLTRLAAWHAAWERPERQVQLNAEPWLGRPERFIWSLWGAEGNDAANRSAFLAARPSGERADWERLLRDPQRVVDALAPYPATLLHNDLDDRNIGLREPAMATDDALPELVLIDWEWLARGPAALDVAKLLQLWPLVIAPGQPLPEMAWSDELAGYYFDAYRQAGGRSMTAPEWRRAYGLARVAHGLVLLPTVHGSLLRTLRGDLPLHPVPGVAPEIVAEFQRASLPPMERLGDLVMSEARRWRS